MHHGLAVLVDVCVAEQQVVAPSAHSGVHDEKPLACRSQVSERELAGYRHLPVIVRLRAANPIAASTRVAKTPPWTVPAEFRC